MDYLYLCFCFKGDLHDGGGVSDPGHLLDPTRRSRPSGAALGTSEGCSAPRAPMIAAISCCGTPIWLSGPPRTRSGSAHVGQAAQHRISAGELGWPTTRQARDSSCCAGMRGHKEMRTRQRAQPGSWRSAGIASSFSDESSGALDFRAICFRQTSCSGRFQRRLSWSYSAAGLRMGLPCCKRFFWRSISFRQHPAVQRCTRAIGASRREQANQSG